MLRPLPVSGLLLGLLLAPSTARAHGGNPAQAVILTPERLGQPVDDSFLIEWLDAGAPPPPTGSALVNLFYTDQMPVTFPLGSIPETLTGTAIVSGILEEEEPNEYLWDVSQVPSGHYWLWARVDEPPEEMSAVYIRFPPVPLTVLHPGDELGPAVALVRPSSEFTVADEQFEIEYQSWDPTGTARIRIEAAPEVFGQEPEWTVVADNIPARPAGAFTWNTAPFPERDWILRATITDCEGRSHRAYGRYYVFVTHLDPVDAGTQEAGPYDGGTLEEWCTQPPPDGGLPPADAGGLPPADTGVAPPADARSSDGGLIISPEEGCGCSKQPVRSRGHLWGVLISLVFFALASRGRLSRP